MRYDRYCITHRSMPFWCVGNPLADPFGGPVLPAATSLEVAELLCKGAQSGYLEKSSFHDDDLVSWDPDHPEDDLDPGSECSRTLRAIKEKLDANKISMHAAVCNLHGNKLFRNGGLTNPDPVIRQLARKKVERTIRIGHFFGAEYFIYWVARDGFESPAGVDWNQVYNNLAEGLNGARRYIAEKNFTNYLGCTVEPKPNEPRGHMFLPTSGHAAGFILGRLEDPAFWSVNPELLQHESMALQNASLTAGYLCSMNLLKFIHFGSQIKAQFDDDFPPLIGPEGLKETAYLFHTLNSMNWKGVCEFDCHMLRCDGNPDRPMECRLDFIRDCARALAMALELAERIPSARPLTPGSTADLDAIAAMCQLTSSGKR